MTFPCSIVQNSTYYGLQFGSDIFLHSERQSKLSTVTAPSLALPQQNLCNKGTHGPTQHAKPSQSDDYSQWSTRTQVHQCACAILSPVVYPALLHFPTLSHKLYDFQIKLMNIQTVCFDLLYNFV